MYAIIEGMKDIITDARDWKICNGPADNGSKNSKKLRSFIYKIKMWTFKW